MFVVVISRTETLVNAQYKLVTTHISIINQSISADKPSTLKPNVVPSLCLRGQKLKNRQPIKSPEIKQTANTAESANEENHTNEGIQTKFFNCT